MQVLLITSIKCCNHAYDTENQHFIHTKVLLIKQAFTQHQTTSKGKRP